MPMVLSITADVGDGDGGSRMLVCHSHGSRNSDCTNDMLAGMGTAPALALVDDAPGGELPSLIMLRKAFPAKALWLTGAMVAVSGVIVGGLALLF
ncbi:permease [Escherichia coli]|uniref:Permease n=1 Tax=Escherichia coli TaxID=562 RepID=A0A376TWI8_ECOLX|nr:permease [Escherichia coli]